MEKEIPEKPEGIKFDFTLKEYQYFCEQCMFSELQEKILEYKIRECSNIEISMKLHIGEATVTREVAKIKKKILKIL